MPVTRPQAIAVAMQAAKAHPEPYMGADFQPHPWVVTAIMVAAADSLRPQMVDVMAVKKSVLSAAFGINSLPELELFHRLEDLCILGIGIGVNGMREALAQEVVAELTRWHGTAHHPVAEALHRISASLQKPAAEATDHPAGYVVNPALDLPEWATGVTTTPVVGAQLCTRDGRRIGNAVIYSQEQAPGRQAAYTCITDAGNHAVLTAVEIDELFHPLHFVMDPARHPGVVLRNTQQRIQRPDSTIVTEAQISAGAAITTMDGKPVGRNAAIDVFHAMCEAGQEGGAA